MKCKESARKCNNIKGIKNTDSVNIYEDKTGLNETTKDNM